jgi:hypothetical protein
MKTKILTCTIIIFIIVLNGCKKSDDSGSNKQSITITTPSGGETWAKGNSYTIKWTSTGITGNVQVRCDYPGSSNTVGNVDISTGQFTFTIPSNWPSRNDWAVAITAFGVTPSGGDIYDWSEPFTIN